MCIEIELIDSIGKFDFKKVLSCDSQTIDTIFGNDPNKTKLLNRITELCENAYNQNDYSYLFIVQDILFNIYQLFTNIPPIAGKSAESSFMIVCVQNLIEEYFLDNENKLIPESTWEKIPRKFNEYIEWLLNLIHGHPAYRHPLYENYLSEYATFKDLQYFLIQESTIDTRFDDFLALLQVGTEGGIKLEIASNYWDEMGNGNESKMHTAMFTRTIKSLDIDTTNHSNYLTTEALVCGNLSLMLSLRRKYFYNAIGYFAVTEYMTPRRFKHILAAWRRNGIQVSEAEYYKEHIAIDAIHAKNWFKNVIKPVIDQNPDVVFEITRGVLYRLNTSKRYLDILLSQFYHSEKNILNNNM
jgi:hypothetical protein